MSREFNLSLPLCDANTSIVVNGCLPHRARVTGFARRNAG